MSRPPPDERVSDVLWGFVRHPVRRLVRPWNWKSALLSSAFRSALFFSANLSAGLDAALAAMLTELLFRGLTAGFYGALTQGFRHAHPAWLASVTAMVLLPLCAHSLELLVHWLSGTVHLARSILVSVAFTALSTVFNLFAMRRGALIVGEDRAPLLDDLRRMPWLIICFVLAIVGRGHAAAGYVRDRYRRTMFAPTQPPHVGDRRCRDEDPSPY